MFQLSMRWFEGVVENRIDPLTLGRVQVRVYGIHTDNLADIPSDELHWMQIMLPVTSGSNSGVSESPQLLEGTHVIGYFRDGDMCQDGLIIGTTNGIPQKFRNPSAGFNDLRTDLSIANVPGKPEAVSPKKIGVTINEGASRHPYPLWTEEPDNSRLFRNENLPAKTVLDAKIKSRAFEVNIPIAWGGTFSEPYPPYNAKYPYNKVEETESGHVFELDNTPLNERVHLAHRAGTFFEFHKDGKSVFKSAYHKYEHTHGDSYQHVNKDKVVTIEEDYKILVNNAKNGSNLLIEILESGNWNVRVLDGDVNFIVNGDISYTATGDVNVTAGKNINLSANGNVNIASGGNTNIDASSLNVDLSGNANFDVNSDVNFSVGDDVKFNVDDNFVVHADNVEID